MDNIGLEITGLGKECSERRMDDLLRQQQEFKVRRSVTFRVTFRDALQPNIASFANHSAVLLLLLVSLQNFSTPQLSLIRVSFQFNSPILPANVQSPLPSPHLPTHILPPCGVPTLVVVTTTHCIPFLSQSHKSCVPELLSTNNIIA